MARLAGTLAGLGVPDEIIAQIATAQSPLRPAVVTAPAPHPTSPL